MKKMLAVLLAVLMVLSMVACSNGGEKETEGTDGKIKLVIPTIGYTAEKIKAEEKRVAEESKELGKEIPFSVEYRVSTMLMERVKEEYPEYDVSWEDWGWAESLDQKQRSSITAGTQVDILTGETFMPTYANEGVLEPLPQDIIDMCVPSMLLYGADGKAYGFADKSSVFMLFWNKDLAAKADLDPDVAPKTWDEFAEMSGKITAAGNGEFYGGGIPSFPHAGGALRATPFFRMNGTDFGKDGQSNLSDPALHEVLQYIRDMDANFPKGLANATDEGPLWDAFEKKGQLGYVINGTWQAIGCNTREMNWGVAPLPTKDGKTAGNCLVGSVFVGVSAKSQHKEEAFNILRLLLEEERQKTWTEVQVVVPSKKVMANKDLFAGNPTMEAAVAAVTESTTTGLAAFAKNDSQVWSIIDQQVLARTTMTQDDIATICADADKQIQPLLK